MNMNIKNVNWATVAAAVVIVVAMHKIPQTRKLVR